MERARSICALELYSKEKLEKAKNRLGKKEQEENDKTPETSEPSGQPPLKRSRWSNIRILHDKNLRLVHARKRREA